jgi:hypothetical protein
MQTRCDALGENLVKAMFIGYGWTYHYETINIQINKIARPSRMTSDAEIEDNFLRKLHEKAVQLDNSLPLMSMHMKGYVPDGRHTGISCNQFPASVDQSTKVTVIHRGSVQYMRPTVRGNGLGAAAANKF